MVNKFTMTSTRASDTESTPVSPLTSLDTQVVSKSTHQELEKLNTILSLFEGIKELLRQPQLEGDSKQKGVH